MGDIQLQQRRQKKLHRRPHSILSSNFEDHYILSGHQLGSGAFSRVEECFKRRKKASAVVETESSNLIYAVKIIEKVQGFYSRPKILREIDTYHLCQGHPNIIQLLEYFEDTHNFHLILEKLEGGPLLNFLQTRQSFFSEYEASLIIQDLTNALCFLHDRGVAHRDVKPENVLCVRRGTASPIKLCDFDLSSKESTLTTTPRLQTPVGSLEYMAPEVLETFNVLKHESDDEQWTYDKSCDIWSLGVLLYLLLSGSPPFVGECGETCGWNQGESCVKCQENLQDAIRRGDVNFPDKPWADISRDAKMLVLSLLSRDSTRRPSAKQVLTHSWVTGCQSSESLITPRQLQKQSSIQELNEFVKTTMAINRCISLESPEKKRFKLRLMNWKSVEANHSTTSRENLKLKNRLMSFSRTIDLEYTVKFCSIDEGI